MTKKLKEYGICYTKNNDLYYKVVKANTEEQAETKFIKSKDHFYSKDRISLDNPKGSNITSIWLNSSILNIRISTKSKDKQKA